MNHDSYYYYPNTADPNRSWNEWNYPAQQSSYVQNYSRSTYNHNHPVNNVRTQNYSKPQTVVNNNRQYFRVGNPTNNRYSKVANPYNGLQRPPLQNQYKRNRTESNTAVEPQAKPAKKRKKPLSQNVPRNNWTIAEAQWALTTEKVLNKKTKNSLIIKFPDQELNKDIVSQFHAAIDNVHFQQPCTPRFCYVTLQDSANAEAVINEINQQKFGNGYLVAEYKRDREEDMVVNAEDIDPLTLYVGNLAQEVTKEDIQTLFPKCKRMDIGFAKKMKFTRYAFIGFHSVTDAVEAFRKTHNHEMYNKSIIVRFRRLHGTVGLPGESKIQNVTKQKDDVPDAIKLTESIQTDKSESSDQSFNRLESSLVDILDMALTSAPPLPPPLPPLPPLPIDDSDEERSNLTNHRQENVNLTEVKQEQFSPNGNGIEDDDEDMFDYFPSSPPTDLLDDRDIKKEEKVNVKLENDTDTCFVNRIKTELPEKEGVTDGFRVKSEPDDDYDLSDIDYKFDEEEEDDDEGDDTNAALSRTNFDDIYESMVNRAQKLSSLKKSQF